MAGVDDNGARTLSRSGCGGQQPTARRQPPSPGDVSIVVPRRSILVAAAAAILCPSASTTSIGGTVTGSGAGVITIREAKFGRSRLVPLHPTATEALSHYDTRRDRLCPRPRSTVFFLSGTGTRLERSGVETTLRKITTAQDHNRHGHPNGDGQPTGT